jgi:hypothetical protein
MHTMQEHPGRWRGCRVVCTWEPAGEDPGSDSDSPRMAKFARVSRPSDA